jgi:molecular chaperone DnaK
VPVEQALKDAKLSTSELDEVVMVGGSTRIPAILELVKRHTGKEPNQTVNPDEVVAVGAAIQGGVLAGEVKDILLLDVTPLSLGVETLGGVMTKMITRNTTIPTKKAEVYSTAVDGQTNVEIHVLQGEREMASDNKSLGTFRLDGIPPAPRGVPQIEVTFDIDANGILSVTAKDKGSGKEQSISITGASTLSDTEVDRMVKDAEANSSADKEKRERVDLKNQAETLVYQAEKQLGELGDKVSAEAKAKVEEKRVKLKEAVEKENFEVADLKSRLEELQQELYALGASVYQQAGGDGATAGATPGGNGNGASAGAASGADDVIDAEFTESK